MKGCSSGYHSRTLVVRLQGPLVAGVLGGAVLPAIFAAFLLYTARANCSSLHCKLTFFADCGCRSPHVGRDSQYSFSLPKLMIKRLGVSLVSWCGSQPIRV